MSASSPTRALLVGLAVTLLAVTVFSWYALLQIDHVRRLQADILDRNRKDSLQLLRIQNNLNSLGLAMRDMVEGSEPYPLDAWKPQFDRIRFDLEDALRVEEGLAPASRTPEQRSHLATSLAQLWASAAEVFERAHGGKAEEALTLIRTSLEPQQASLTALVARLLVGNNEAEERAAARMQSIYDGVARNIYLFVGAVLVAIFGTSLYLIQANRRIFRQLERLSDQRSELAREMIGVQEQVFHSVSRELHDEFGQILTAVGTMLGRAEKHDLPDGSPFHAQVTEVREIVQHALEKVRSLAQVLHPSVLDDYGLEKAIEWYTEQFGRQTGVVIGYEKVGSVPEVEGQTAIHVYRIVQEALNNVVRHSGAGQAWVRVCCATERLRLEVEDHGCGLPPNASGGLGLVAMRERAEILRGTLQFERPAEGGTRVVLDVPFAAEPAP